MSLRIPAIHLEAFVALGWRCTFTDDNWCQVESDEASPLVPCFDCDEPCIFGEWQRIGARCWACFDDEESVVVH